MTTEQINRLARAYAIDRGLAGCENPCARTMMLDAIEYLLRDHLIVEKSKADNLWDASQLNSGMHYHDDVVQADAVANALQYLFPNEFNQDE